jgi:DNA modification methylase
MQIKTRTKITEGTLKVNITEIIIGEKNRTDMGDLLSLASSMSSNGLLNPIIITRDNQLISGLRRLEAAKLLKWEKIEVRLFETLSPVERRKVEIEEDLAQKKIRSWQEEVALKKELHDLLQAEKGARKAGPRGKKNWSQKNTADRLGVAKTSLSEDIRLADALKAFPELAKATTKKDAIRKMYAMRELALLQALSKKAKELGIEIEEAVTLKQGDAYVMLKTLADESFNCCVTDPPWGIDIQDSSTARSNDYIMFKDTADLWIKFLKEGLPEIFRVLKEGSHLWLFFGPEFYKETRDALELVGFDVRYIPCVWTKEKPNYTDFEYKPMPQYESFFFAIRRKNKEVAPHRLTEATSDVFVYSRSTVSRIHRTEKPIDLIKRLITLSTDSGDSVLDPFAGSASTLCAAFMSGRRALGFELDQGMYDAANGRLQALKVTGTGEEADELLPLATTIV